MFSTEEPGIARFFLFGVGVNTLPPVLFKKTLMRSLSPLLLAAVLPLFLLSSCYRDVFGIEGSGPATSETRMPGSFNGVELSIDADVTLHADSVCHVVVSAQSNVLHVLETDVHGSTLRIGFSRNVCRHNAIHIDLYAPAFVLATISGSGNIHNSDAICNGNFKAAISGSGNIELGGVQANDAEANISGSGNIRLSGTANSITTRTSGSGDMHLYDLPVNSGNVRISGSGNVEINAAQFLDINISGSGDVYYKNNPSVNVSISGSGHVHHVN